MAEVVRLLHTVIGKVDGLAVKLDRVEVDVQVLKTGVQVLKTGVGHLETRMERLEGKVDLLNGQFRDVVGKTMANTERIARVESRIDILERKAN